MILWSTKDCRQIFVNDHLWKRKKGIERVKEGNGSGEITFGGMTAAWYYDGKKMIEPLILKESDFISRWDGDRGELVPQTQEDLSYVGDPSEYRVNIDAPLAKFRFRMRPWSPFLSEQRFRANTYMKNMGYQINKIFGTKLRGTITTKEGEERIKGSAYFQKVTVFAPAIPWYWVVMHIEDGSYIDYYKPHIGLPMLRRYPKPKSPLDFGELALNRSIEYYHAPSDTLHRFKKMSVYKTFTPENLPIFHVEGRAKDKRIRFTLRSYSRAYWRFEQPFWGNRTSILYYNEYPIEMMDFHFSEKGMELGRSDLGYVVGNCEHTWGSLFKEGGQASLKGRS